MNHLAIFAVLTVVLCSFLLSEGTFDWLDEERFGLYQQAWKTIEDTKSATYYLARTNYPDDVGSWGNNFSCLAVRVTDTYNDNKTVRAVFYFYNKESQQEIKSVTEEVQAMKQHKYSTYENAIHYVVKPRNDLIDTVAFTDETCDIFHVPYANNGEGGFELWVRGQRIDDIPDYCLFLFKLFIPSNSTVYEKYRKEMCTEVVKKVQTLYS